MITTFFGTCCCKKEEPTNTCAKFAASVMDAACPASVLIEGDFTFEVFTAGGSSRGCLGMPTTRPLWGKVRRGPIRINSVLHRVRCNQNTPYLTEYKIQETCTEGCNNDATDYPLLCPDDCSTYNTGCRTYIARENPCDDSNHTDEIGTELTCNLLMALPVTSERRMPCTGVQFYTCSHFGGSDGYTSLPATGNVTIVTPLREDSHELVAPLLPTSAATGSPYFLEACPSCFNIDFPVFGPFSPSFPACTGTARCTSKVIACPSCDFTVEENCVLPHLRAAVTGVTCYTVKDAYNNCAETWIHIALPEIFSGPWRDGDPFIPGQINNIKRTPAGIASYYPKLLSAGDPNNASNFDNSEGIIRASGTEGYRYPFTWAKKITTVPECIPQGQYVMFGNMGSGLTPTVYNRCQATCVGTNSAGQSLTYQSTSEDFTLPFTGCLNYFQRTAPFETCFEMYYATGDGSNYYGDGTIPQIGVTCSDPWCCCRPARVWTYRSNESNSCDSDAPGYPVITGPRDPRICHTFNAKPFPQYTNVSELTRYYAHNHPRNECTKGLGGGFVVRDRNHPLWTCTGYRCCGDPWDCAINAEDGLYVIPCGGLGYTEDTRVYSCPDPTGGPLHELRCPTGTCLYNIMPHGLTTHIYVHLLREFPPTLQLTWL